MKDLVYTIVYLCINAVNRIGYGFKIKLTLVSDGMAFFCLILLSRDSNKGNMYCDPFF